MVRYKNRYIVAEIHPKHVPKFTEYNERDENICRAVFNKIIELYGDFGIAAVKTGILVKYWNAQLRTVFIRVRHGPHRFVSSSLPLIDKINNNDATIHILYSGATMKQCYKFLIKYHRKRALKDLIHIEDKNVYNKLFNSFIHIRNEKKM